MSTNSLNPLPPSHSIPSRDEAWEARELKFHQESIKQINDLVRRMNAQAPAVEMSKVRGEVLRNEVWVELQRRTEDYLVRQQFNATSRTPSLFESESLTRLTNATKRSLSTIARPVAAVIGRGRIVGTAKDRDTWNESG